MGKYVYIEGKRRFTDLEGNPVNIERATTKSAGYDLCAAKEVFVKPNSMMLVPTGVKAVMADNEFLMLAPRSSLAIKRNLILKNIIGIIDADYDEEIFVALWNRGKQIEYINKGDRIAQGIFMNYLTTGDSPTTIRKGGIGSTGR